MTAQEMIVQVYEDTGEDSRNCPYTDVDDPTTFSIAAAGSIKILARLNQGLVRIANWRFRDGVVLRLRGLLTKAYAALGTPYSGDVVSATDTTVTIPGLGSDYDGEFDGWIIEITAGTSIGETNRIISSVVSGANVVCTVAEEWTTNPDATSDFDLYKSFARFVKSAAEADAAYHIDVHPITELADVIAIKDVTQGIELEKTYFNEKFTSSEGAAGTPTQYWVYGNQIRFDVALNERRTYEILYVRQPVALAAAADIPDIPEQYHEAVVLWAIHSFQRKVQDFEKGYATKREVEDLMMMLRPQGQFENEFSAGGLVIYG
jgi:hypothetical protein